MWTAISIQRTFFHSIQIYREMFGLFDQIIMPQLNHTTYKFKPVLCVDLFWSTSLFRILLFGTKKMWSSHFDDVGCCQSLIKVCLFKRNQKQFQIKRNFIAILFECHSMNTFSNVDIFRITCKCDFSGANRQKIARLLNKITQPVHKHKSIFLLPFAHLVIATTHNQPDNGNFKTGINLLTWCVVRYLAIYHRAQYQLKKPKYKFKFDLCLLSFTQSM